MPIWNGTKNLFSCNLREGPHRYLARRWVKGSNFGSSPLCRNGTLWGDVEKPGGRSVPVRIGRTDSISKDFLSVIVWNE
ncbi:MAG: hypothetical protein WCT99_08010 [Bacteroidota bacterium]